MMLVSGWTLATIIFCSLVVGILLAAIILQLVGDESEERPRGDVLQFDGPRARRALGAVHDDFGDDAA